MYKLYALTNEGMKKVLEDEDETHIDEQHKLCIEDKMLVWKITVNIKENEEI